MVGRVTGLRGVANSLGIVVTLSVPAMQITAQARVDAIQSL